jgi:hypothetical protein
MIVERQITETLRVEMTQILHDESQKKVRHFASGRENCAERN